MSRDLLETFPNPNPERDYIIEHTANEFTSLCPKTGQPDFAVITLTYVPDELCVELKALKLYYQSYRNEGIFYEAAINKIINDFIAVCKPRWAQIEGKFGVRGGISSVVTIEYDKDVNP